MDKLKNTFVIEDEMFTVQVLGDNLWQLVYKRGETVVYDKKVTKGKGAHELRKWSKRKIDRLCEHG